MNYRKWWLTYSCKYKGGAKSNIGSVVLSVNSRTATAEGDGHQPGWGVFEAAGQDPMIQLFQQTHSALFTAKHIVQEPLASLLPSQKRRNCHGDWLVAQ